MKIKVLEFLIAVGFSAASRATFIIFRGHPA